MLLNLLMTFLINNSSASVVGYGSSDAVLPAKNQELFYMGFELALRQKFSPDELKSKLVVESSNNGSALGAKVVAESLVKKNAELLVGFPTSHEALLAAKIITDNNKFGIFSGAGHDDLGKMGPMIVTTGESMVDSIRSTLSFIKKRNLGKKGAVIVNPFAVFSKNQADLLKQNYNDKDFNLSFVSLNKDKMLSSADLAGLRSNDFIIVTPYADESVKFLEQFRESKLDLPIITNSSWTTGDLELIRRFLVDRKSPVYSATLWLKGSSESMPIEKLIKEKYGREAVAEMMYGFDLGVIVRNILSKLPTTFTAKDVKDVFYKINCFSNTSVGTLCFDKSGGHVKRKIYFVQFHKENFIKVE